MVAQPPPPDNDKVLSYSTIIDHEIWIAGCTRDSNNCISLSVFQLCACLCACVSVCACVCLCVQLCTCTVCECQRQLREFVLALLFVWGRVSCCLAVLLTPWQLVLEPWQLFRPCLTSLSVRSVRMMDAGQCIRHLIWDLGILGIEVILSGFHGQSFCSVSHLTDPGFYLILFLPVAQSFPCGLLFLFWSAGKWS